MKREKAQSLQAPSGTWPRMKRRSSWLAGKHGDEVILSSFRCILAYCCVASISILWLRLGSVGGKQSGSLFCWASALKDPAASNASAICSVSPLTPVTPTLGPPGVLAGGGAVGPSVFLIWEGIWSTRKWSHLYNTCHSVYRPEIHYIWTGPATRACKCNCILRSRVWRENNCFLNQHEIINKCINAFCCTLTTKEHAFLSKYWTNNVIL